MKKLLTGLFVLGALVFSVNASIACADCQKEDAQVTCQCPKDCKCGCQDKAECKCEGAEKCTCDKNSECSKKETTEEQKTCPVKKFKFFRKNK